jgi:phosphohistidine phosphatase SixA
MFRFIFALVLLSPLPPAVAQQAPAPSSQPERTMPAKELLAELRRGGYVLYFRHAATDFGRNDEKMRGFEDCANQRNLVDRGREDARRIGAAVRALRIPAGKVYASPYCRTVETAQLIFGRAEKMQEVRGGPGTATDPARYAGLRRLLETRTGTGENLVIVSHGNPFHAVAGPPYLAEGEMAVVRPLGERFAIAARVPVEGWGALLAADAGKN